MHSHLMQQDLICAAEETLQKEKKIEKEKI
jgi:hypothetical protein